MVLIDFQLEPKWGNIIKWSFLWTISQVYTFLVRIRLFLFRIGIFKTRSSQKPVISIGNITVGGTGKSPMIDRLLEIFDENGLSSAVLTRGYKSKKGGGVVILNQQTAPSGSCVEFGDEPWMLFQKHPKTSFYISPERYLSAKLAEPKADLLLLDDGMQHIRLKRDLNIVMIDSMAGVGNGYLLPLGPLREPLNQLKRADVIIYTRCNLKSADEIMEKIRGFLPGKIKEWESELTPMAILSSKRAEIKQPEWLNGKKCLLFSGVGNPSSFTKLVDSLGGIVVDHLVFPDHEGYQSETQKRLEKYFQKNEYDLILCTEKDWSKLESFKEYLPEICRLKIELKLKDEAVSFLINWAKFNLLQQG
ncbi:MAG: tetraacyldisaccharide 4'-kinase [Deltaproteobacteria bacterium]|nr:tetraacyldisaccharide 4'-kinase [Deltaproteobacteria bacterium]